MLRTYVSCTNALLLGLNFLSFRYQCGITHWFICPGIVWNRDWWKGFFEFHTNLYVYYGHVADLLVGLFIRSILKLRRVPDKLCTFSVMVWLLNPFTFTIGTRGNCEPIVCAMILWIIICLMNGIFLLPC